MKALLRVFDLAVAALVIFPLITGGIRLGQPGLKIELSELAVPTLLVALLALLLRALGTDPRESFFARGAASLWRGWCALLDDNPTRILVRGAMAVGFAFSVVALHRHWAFQSSTWDLGIFTNALYNLAHGNGYV